MYSSEPSDQIDEQLDNALPATQIHHLHLSHEIVSSSFLTQVGDLQVSKAEFCCSQNFRHVLQLLHDAPQTLESVAPALHFGKG